MVPFPKNPQERKVIPLVEVRRKKGESFESLLRRFSRRVQQSGKVLQAKKIRFYTPPKSKLELRRSALHRIDVRDKLEYMVRAGKIKEEDLQVRKKKRSRS